MENTRILSNIGKNIYSNAQNLKKNDKNNAVRN